MAISLKSLTGGEAVAGLSVLLKKFTVIEKRSAKKVLTAMVKAKLGVIAKQIKKDTSSKVKAARKGVGIGPTNIHWWVVGPAKRTTGAKNGKISNKKVANRGRMPAMQPGLAAEAAAKSKGQQNKLMIERGALALKKELIKLKLKGK